MTTLKKFGKPVEGSPRFSLGDRNLDVARALASAFGDVDCAEVVHGDLLDVSPDAVVCPGNSFGDMGGGFDKAVDDFHGGRAQPAVVRALAGACYGELPVGSGLVVEVPSTARARFLVMAPTMRVPGNAADSIGAYLATRAALVAVLQHNARTNRRIDSVAIPGMCTGVGGMALRRGRVADAVGVRERARGRLAADQASGHGPVCVARRRRGSRRIFARRLIDEIVRSADS